jgi:hypothetical protein
VSLRDGPVLVMFSRYGWSAARESHRVTLGREDLGEEDPIRRFVVMDGVGGVIPVYSADELTSALVGLLRLTENFDLVFARVAFDRCMAVCATSLAYLCPIGVAGSSAVDRKSLSSCAWGVVFLVTVLRNATPVLRLSQPPLCPRSLVRFFGSLL